MASQRCEGQVVSHQCHTWCRVSHLLWAAQWCWYQGHWAWWRAGCPSYDPPFWSKEHSWHKDFHGWGSYPPVSTNERDSYFGLKATTGFKWYLSDLLYSYQVVHSPCQLFSHFKLPCNVDTTFVLFQIDVQRPEFTILLHHHVWQRDEKISFFKWQNDTLKQNYENCNVTSLRFTAAYLL